MEDSVTLSYTQKVTGERVVVHYRTRRLVGGDPKRETPDLSDERDTCS